MKKVLRVLMGALMISGFMISDVSAADTDTSPDIDPMDIEIINDLDMLENWDDLQNAKAFEDEDLEVETTTGADYDA